MNPEEKYLLDKLAQLRQIRHKDKTEGMAFATGLTKEAMRISNQGKQITDIFWEGLGFVLYLDKNYNLAEQILLEGIKQAAAEFSPGHRIVIKMHSNLVNIYEKQGKWEEALGQSQIEVQLRTQMVETKQEQLEKAKLRLDRLQNNCK